MRKGSLLIHEQLQMAAMALHGLYSSLCDEGGVDGSTPELEAQIDAVKAAGDATSKAMAALKPLTEAA